MNKNKQQQAQQHHHHHHHHNQQQQQQQQQQHGSHQGWTGLQAAQQIQCEAVELGVFKPLQFPKKFVYHVHLFT